MHGRLIGIVLMLGGVGLPQVAAQDAALLGPPLLGYMIDAEGTFRPLLGLPGATVWGDANRLDVAFQEALISPRHDFILLKAEQLPVLLTKPPLAERFEVLPAAGFPDSWRLSPRGRALALHYAAANILRVLSGLPDEAAPARDVDLSGLPGPLGAYAVTDDAGILLVASGGQLFEDRWGQLNSVAALGEVSAIEFYPGGQQALITDRKHNAVYQWKDSALTVLVDETRGIVSPSAAGISGDGQRVIVIVDGGWRLAVVDLNQDRLSFLEIPEQVAGVRRLRGNCVFGLVGVVGGPLLVLDGDLPEPAIFVIPPVGKGAAGGDQ